MNDKWVDGGVSWKGLGGGEVYSMGPISFFFDDFCFLLYIEQMDTDLKGKGSDFCLKKLNFNRFLKTLFSIKFARAYPPLLKLI